MGNTEVARRNKIEELRLRMYQAYEEDPSGKQVIKISQELDQAILKVQKQQSVPR